MPNKQSGFTLIEILVSLAIMMTIMGLGIASFIRFNDRQQVRGAAKEIQTMFRTAQAKSQVREVPVDAACTSLNGYRVTRSSSNLLTLSTRCDSTSYSTRDSYTLPSGITVNYTFRYAEYEALTGRAAFRNEVGTSVPSITVTVTNGTTSYSFLAESGGSITEGDFD